MIYKVTTLNLQGYTDWSAREQSIISFLDSEGSDFVLLQEVKFDSTYSVQNQAEYLNSKLTHPYKHTAASITRYYEPSTGEPYKEGLAVFSRLPILRSEALALTRSADDKHQRIIQNVDIETNAPLKLSNIHLSNNEHSVEQLSELLSIFSRRNERRIIAGDFNIFSLQECSALYETEYKASVGYKKYISYPSQGQTLDYALLPREYSYKGMDITSGLSDHTALSFTVEI